MNTERRNPETDFECGIWNIEYPTHWRDLKRCNKPDEFESPGEESPIPTRE
jgi:hypothetical protein